MASIFTYDPDPPRVASPWLGVRSDTKEESVLTSDPNVSAHELLAKSTNNNAQGSSKVLRLQAEPQEGPVEYKLHLLLRPRRKFKSTSTVTHVSGSRHGRVFGPPSSRTVSEPVVTAGPSASLTQQNRQHRLEQLTTQLMWRLQQSSPHHTSSATNIILPSLPEALPELQAPQQLAKLLHGLEESQGALYEVGVSDDGTLVGLADDEMEESLNNLRAMAACLGCTVEVLRKEVVGDCEWIEDTVVGGKDRQSRRHGKLFVVEALVKPSLSTKRSPITSTNSSPDTNEMAALSLDQDPAVHAIEQLRITLTGPTMSGKSTLLGTLTTSTLDNGRGKSRLSMLKHRHEITSGVTSSVTQELLGYQDAEHGDVEVINYGLENVASWIDIHVAASGSRLVFVSDSAGHPRYRRTTVKGLVGWAPHWTLLCIPADATEDIVGRTESSQQDPPKLTPDADVSGAQLDLCLRLGLPLVVVITKLDLASRSGLKTSLSKVLDALKSAGRKPAILPNAPNTNGEVELGIITSAVLEQAYNTCIPLLNDPSATVPIVLTSAVHGSGIRNLHALLHELPIPRPTQEDNPESTSLFQIEDIYTKFADVQGVIVSGRLRMGKITIGDTMVLGPFSTHDRYEDSEDSDERPVRRPSSYLPASRSFPGALRDSHLNPLHFQIPGQEWKSVKITSIRNLRLPVVSLLPDQVGTLAVVPEDNAAGKATISPAVLTRARKGMVLAAVQPLAVRSFVAEFSREDLESLAVGNHVVVYSASVRASAKVVSARAPDSPDGGHEDHRVDLEHDAFRFDEEGEKGFSGDGATEKVSVAGTITARNLLVTFGFDSSKEVVLVGDRVLVMPGGGPSLYGGQERGQKGVAGLDGFVGMIVEVHG